MSIYHFPETLLWYISLSTKDFSQVKLINIIYFPIRTKKKPNSTYRIIILPHSFHQQICGYNFSKC